MILSAEYRAQDRLEEALLALREAGVSAEEIALFSAKPVELPEGLLDRPGRMSLVSILCALALGIGFTSFMFWAQLDYPLITGGMPIVSAWPVGVVIFEVTMGGAVVGVMLSFFLQGRFFRRPRIAPPAGPRDPESIVLSAIVPDDRKDEFQAILSS